MNMSSTVGFACNVSQFIDSASRSLSAIQRFNKSCAKSEGNDQEVNDLVSTLLTHTKLVHFSPPEGVTLLSEEEDICLGLAKQCQQLSLQISTCLQRFVSGCDLEDQLASRTVLSENSDDIQQALFLIKEDLNDRLATHQWLTISRTIRELSAKNNRLSANRTTEIKELAAMVDTSLQQIKSKDTDDDKKLEIWLQVCMATHKAMDYAAEQVILSDLQFWTMGRRKDLISKEHENTFEWILTQGPSDDPLRPAATFASWISTDEPLYWIAGKPGSGKSTLMKHIADSPKTMDGLKQWAGDDALVTASFYFWSSAKDPLQKSATGLLRSILFQILRQCPSLIQHAYPNQWEHRQPRSSSRRFAPVELTLSELLTIYQRISTLILITKVKFCFFIDGLDEYDGQPDDVIRLIISLSKTDNVKVCTSSRQWTEFEAMFGGDNPWKLYIHHLTKGDMKLYAEDLLSNNSRLNQMKEAGGEDTIQSLVRTIVDKAEGVFLWVLLVVRSLLDGLADKDEMSDLQHRLAVIPNDLDQYFSKVFLDIEPHMRVQTAQVFQVTLNTTEKLPLMCYWFIREESLKAVKDMKQRSLSRETAMERLNEMSQWLHTYSQGLLKCNNMMEGIIQSSHLEENQWLFEFRVDFLHRTVADFLRTAQMTSLLKKWSVNSFDIDFEICKACLATIKITPPTAAMFGDISRAISILHLLLVHAKPLERDSQADLLDESLSSLRRHSITLHEIHAIILGPGNYWAYDSSFNFAMLYHFVSYGLGDYTTLKLDRGGLKFEESPSGLLSGCFSWNPRVRPGNFALDIETIGLLLRRHLDPNMPWGDRGFSFWQQLLTTTYSRHLKGSLTQEDCDAIRCSIDHGAELDDLVEVFAARRMGSTKAVDIVEKVLPREQFLALRLARS